MLLCKLSGDADGIVWFNFNKSAIVLHNLNLIASVGDTRSTSEELNIFEID